MERIDVEASRRAWTHASHALGIDGVTDDASLVRGFRHRHRNGCLRATTRRRFPAGAGARLLHVDRLALVRDERSFFEDTLNDWQWFGDGDPPGWYTGEPWS